MDVIKYIFIPFLVSLLLTPLVKVIATKLEVYAQMNERTVHNGKIARIGGVSIFLAFVICISFFMETDDTINGILIGGAIMFIGGLVDDMLTLSPKSKLLFQSVAAIILMYMSDVSLDIIRLPFNISIDMGFISAIVTFGWLIGITNAVNLIDGLDGLAGGISTIILIVIATMAIVEGRLDVQIIALCLAGAILGFLIFNFHPASIFMGDCGALFLGFVIASISLLGFKSSTIMTLALPILLLGIPIIDTLGAILRRKLKGHKFSQADKEHIHHILMRKFGHRNTVLILYVVTALFGFTAYMYLINKNTGFILLFIIAIIVEMFIEITGMISPSFHPILGIIRSIKKRLIKKK